MPGTVLYDGPRYVACWIDRGAAPFLTVQRKRGKPAGLALHGIEAAHWRDAIVTAFDDAERAALCRAMLQSWSPAASCNRDGPTGPRRRVGLAWG